MIAPRRPSELSLVLVDGQFVFGFHERHRQSLKAEREKRRQQRLLYNAQLRRDRRGSLRHLLELSDLPESHLSVDELKQLDAYVWHTATKEVQAKWTPQREAEARGVDVRAAAKLFWHDGRIYQAERMTVSEGVELGCFE